MPLEGLVATELAERLGELARDAERRGRQAMLSVTRHVEIADPAACAFASRLASDRWFAWEEPDAGFALAGLGTAAEIVARGEGRFTEVDGACARFLSGRLADEPTGLPAGAGLVWTGGFAFDPDGGNSAQFASLPPALMVAPELALARAGDTTWLTIAARYRPGDRPEAIAAAAQTRLAALREAPLALLDPDPVGAVRVESARDPRTYENAVANAVARIRRGELTKVVLAREVRAEAPRAHDPAALFGALRELFPSCYCFCVGTPEAAFLGASPELLVRRRGAGAQTVALAGSTRRSADPAVDSHLAEQLMRSAKNAEEHEIVAARIARALRPYSVWVERSRTPEVIQVANIQHLATPIHAQLADAHSAVELAGVLHPTPAVGGEPADRAVEVISALEGFDRGWYAGPVGWMDAAEDGEFCVALRSALLRDRVAHLFAGAGIVADSAPESELAETELKLGALLPLLAH